MEFKLLDGYSGDVDLYKKRIKESEKYKHNLNKTILDYSSEYHKEIKEGTEKKLLLLEDGIKKGLNEDEILQKYGKFIPSDKTPTLNLLYFMLRETDVAYDAKYIDRDKINKDLIDSKMVDFIEDDIFDSKSIVNKIKDSPEFLSEEDIEDYNNTKSEYRNLINSEFDKLKEDKSPEETLKEPPNMEEFLFGDVTLTQFDTIRKLKRLALENDNSSESTQAFEKCEKLCKKHGLEMDKIRI